MAMLPRNSSASVRIAFGLAPGVEIQDDSAGQKGGLVRGSAFFHGDFWEFYWKK
jgi:hypothetical protein